MDCDAGEIILEISAPGAGTVASRIAIPGAFARRGIGRPALRDWIAKRRRSRFHIIAGGLPPRTTEDSMPERCYRCASEITPDLEPLGVIYVRVCVDDGDTFATRAICTRCWNTTPSSDPGREPHRVLWTALP